MKYLTFLVVFFISGCGPKCDDFVNGVCWDYQEHSVNLTKMNIAMEVLQEEFSKQFGSTEIIPILRQGDTIVHFVDNLIEREERAGETNIWHESITNKFTFDIYIDADDCWTIYYVTMHEFMHVLATSLNLVPTTGLTEEDGEYSHMTPNLFLLWARLSETDANETVEGKIIPKLRPLCTSE